MLKKRHSDFNLIKIIFFGDTLCLYIIQNIINNMKIYTKEEIDIISRKYLNGEKILRTEKIYHQGLIGLRKKNILYSHSNEELIEYAKCSQNIYYFIENYTDMKLRDFQKDIIKHHQENRFTISMTSPQTGTNRIIILIHLHDILFKGEYSVFIMESRQMNSLENIEIFKEYYKQLPFFLQKGVVEWEIKMFY